MQVSPGRHSHARVAVSIVLCALLAVPFVPATSAQTGDQADAVCATNQVPDPTSDEQRFFCEPMDSAGFIQFEQFTRGLELLESEYPEWLEVKIVGESLNGLPIYFVEVTNEQSEKPRDQKLQIGYSASIHANEAAGREGMTRVLEDLAAGVGPYGAELQPILDDVILNVWFPNPDSWRSGDFFRSDYTGIFDGDPAVLGYARVNAAGFDLNRQLPNPGWIEPDHQPASQPEAQAFIDELRYSGNHSNLVAGADLHGMIGSPNMIRSIIPNQDYDLRRMALIVDQLRTVQERVEENPAFDEWNRFASIDDLAEQLLGEEVGEDNGIVAADFEKPFEWGARWDMIGYTDTGFTSDYMTLSPRSPTGGMGAVGTIVEFAYSHMVPDNKYVAKLTDMHVAGVREIVRTQLEMAGRLETPVLAGTGPVAYIDDGVVVSSEDDPNAYRAPHGKDFDIDDPEAKFDFNQNPYEVTNLRFWEDLGRFSSDPVEPLTPSALDADTLSGYAHLAITNQALDALDDVQVSLVQDWVADGGHLLLTDSALRYFDRAGITDDAARQLCVYVGHSDLQDMDHPLLADVDWGARVTGEASAVGFKANSGSDWNYPMWGLDLDAFSGLQGDLVGTTTGHEPTANTCENDSNDPVASLGRVQSDAGTIDFLGGALPLPTQAFDHRYGLADYSVSALTYWVVVNSLGGQISWEPIEEPFVPYYDFDPLYGDQAQGEAATGASEDTPALPAVVFLGVLAVVALVARRRR